MSKRNKKQKNGKKPNRKKFERGYEAAEYSNRRRPAPSTTSSEDYILNSRKRTRLSANARDLARNLSLLDWAIRTYLAYVTDLTFAAKTPDREWNAYLEKWWSEKSKPWNFDVAGRHDLQRSVRLTEAGRILDGDIAWLLYDRGPYRGLVQAIEGDRIEMPDGGIPTGQSADEWINGIRIDPKTGKTLAYAICRRNGTRKELDQTVPAKRVLFHPWYGWRHDQLRGVSPIVASLDTLRDYHETIEYAKAKAKLSQVLGLAIMTQASNGEVFEVGQVYGDSESDSGCTEPSSDGCQPGSMSNSLDGGAPFVANLEPGESLEVIESKTPSNEVMVFVKHLVQQVLLSLDIPYSMYSEEFANYAGQRAALMKWIYCLTPKVRELQNFLTQYARWAMGIAVEDGQLILPEGKDFSFIEFEFVQGGVPFDQPQREAEGVRKMIAMGLDNPYDAAKAIGTNYERNVDLKAQAIDYAKSKGVPVDWGEASSSPTTELIDQITDAVEEQQQ